MKIAIIHDHLIQQGGAEKVLETMHEMWPEAPTYTLFFDPKKLPEFASHDIRTSFLQKMPMALTKYKMYIALMPTATERHDLSEFDVVVSSSSAFSKGVITRPGSIHICYCHTPTRYLWSDTHSYVEELRIPRIMKAMLPPLLTYLRIWDRHAAGRVDYFIANSNTVAERIKKYYGRSSDIIYPPVDTHKFNLSHAPKNYFLTGGRLVAYKRFDLAVEAANKTGLPLKIFGSGPMEEQLRKMAKSNVEFLGRVSDKEQARLYAEAKAFLHPHEEDFGITAIESMASGRPVIALRRGGATETVVEGVTGEFMDEQSWEELADILIRFENEKYDPHAICKHAEQFSRTAFKNKLQNLIETKILSTKS
ncbi:MAG: glycosyltransferase [Patescibacteria group bacterium]